jgi:hypothetical protein
MKIEQYNSLYDANRNTKLGPPPLDAVFHLSPEEKQGVIAGVERFEQRLGEFVGRDVGQGLWFGDGYLFYGTDDWEEESYFGVRKMDVRRESWSVLCHSDRGGEATAADMTNRFEDAWKSAMAEIIRKVFRGSEMWHAGRRTGVFFNCVPPQVDHLVLTEELAREIYEMDTNHGLSDRDEIFLKQAAKRSHTLWRSQIYPDAWVNSITARINTPEAAWGFNLSIPDFVDLAFDWALSPKPLDGTPLSQVKWSQLTWRG